MMLTHATLGFCAWDILAAAVLLAVIVVIAVKSHNYRKVRGQMEREIDQLSQVEITEQNNG